MKFKIGDRVASFDYDQASTDTGFSDSVYRTPATVLRMKADEIEKRDADIQAARLFVEKHKK